MNYYNEHNPEAAAWLRELIRAGVIPNGHVDERSIADVQPSDLSGYTQCHFFAGIGGWSYALRLAGWNSVRPVWTGSCPCQPFSLAGKRKGTNDERHLWPEFFRLIRECRPSTIFGEQVASPDAMQWFDGVSTDLEGEGYACGAADLCAASVGAPHIRQRLYWVADMPGARPQRSELESEGYTRETAERGCVAGGVVQSNSAGREQGIATTEAARYGRAVESASCNGRMGDPESELQERKGINQASDGRQGSVGGSGAWSDYDIIQCLDGKARRVKSQSQSMVDGLSDYLDALRDVGASEAQIIAALCSFPLVQNTAGRSMLLKGYGNAIVPSLAAQFVLAFGECVP